MTTPESGPPTAPAPTAPEAEATGASSAAPAPPTAAPAASTGSGGSGGSDAIVPPPPSAPGPAPVAPGSALAASEAAPAAPEPTPAAPGSSSPARRRRAATPATRTPRGIYVVPALLAVALVLLVVGLATSRSVWLAASLVASVLAAVLLVVERVVQRRRGDAVASSGGAATADGLDTGPGVVDLDAPAIDPDDPDAVWVVDGRPRYHVRGCETVKSLPVEPVPLAQALEDGFVACSLCEPPTSVGASGSG